MEYSNTFYKEIPLMIDQALERMGRDLDFETAPRLIKSLDTFFANVPEEHKLNTLYIKANKRYVQALSQFSVYPPLEPPIQI